MTAQEHNGRSAKPYHDSIIGGGLFAACTGSALLLYPSSAGSLVLTTFVVPVVFIAGRRGHIAGLVAGIVATAVTSIVVAIRSPEVLPGTVAAGLLVFVGIGGLVGLLAETRRRLASRTVEAELALRRSEEAETQYRTLFEAVPVALYRSTPDGRIVDANALFASVLGHESRADLVGRMTMDYYQDPADRSALRQCLDNGGRVDGMEVSLHRADGTPFVGRLSVRVTRPADGSVFFDGTLVDVTIERELERQRLAIDAQKRRIDRMLAVTDLAAGVAHEINNKLAAIRLQAQLLSVAAMDPTRVGESAKAIAQTVDQAAGIVDGLLAATGSRPVVLELVDLGEIAGGAIAARPDASGVTLIAPEPPPYVQGDQELLTRCIGELIDNAIAACDPDGRVTVTVSADVDSVPGDDALETRYACVSVADNGRGMDEPTRDRMFEPYFTTAAFGSGAGLGLTRVFGIVNQHRGTISVDSAERVGTTVRVFIPMAAPAR